MCAESGTHIGLWISNVTTNAFTICALDCTEVCCCEIFFLDILLITLSIMSVPDLPQKGDTTSVKGAFGTEEKAPNHDVTPVYDFAVGESEDIDFAETKVLK